MYVWLMGLPVWLQALVVIGVASLGSLAVFRTLITDRQREGHNEVLGLIFATCGVVYAVLLGFMVFAVIPSTRGPTGW